MRENIPVFIYHEVGQKQTFGAGSKQNYAVLTVKQAEKYNENVILIGDKYNTRMVTNAVVADELTNEKWEEFEKHFVNMTTDYPDAWAKGFFKRFYLIEEYMKRYEMAECIILDSDILTYVNYSEYFRNVACDAAFGISPRQELAGVPYKNELRGAASIHVSFFSLEALSDFTSFCIDQYSNVRGLLAEKWEAHQKYNLAGGITEMTLLYIWVKSRPEMHIFNLMEEHNNTVFDWSSLGPEGYNDENEFLFDLSHKIKVIKYIDGLPFFQKSNGTMLRVLAVHFGGTTKTFMYDYYKKQKIGLTGDVRWLLVKIRKVLSKIKHGFK